MTATTHDTHDTSHGPKFPDPLPRIPLVWGPSDYDSVSQQISEITEKPQPYWWWPALLISAALLSGGVIAATYLISTGVGVWGSNVPVAWAFDITNFVFWIGIGHAGTLISAILFLFRQKWRTSINRFSEAMTIFAVICAGVYPGIHVGRFWYAWFMFPLPNANHIFQNFRSALLWDLFAVSTYFSISLIFWYIGLIPDLATLRDRAKGRSRQMIFGFLSLGWRGSTRHWRHYEVAYLMLAGLSTPLVLSVHSVVSFDFATSLIPGWHTTIFPPYFVAGAIFGGFAMVLQCMIPARAVYKLENVVTIKHIDVMCKFILATGTIVGYAYCMELFIAWFSGNPYEWQTFKNRAIDGDYTWAYWVMMSCNLFIPQVFWIRWCRQTPWFVVLVVTFVNVGMWYERFVIIVQSLHHDFLPGSWGQFHPTWVDWLQMIGDFGLFFTFTLLFIRVLPMVAIAEVKGVLPMANPHSFHLGEEAAGAPIPPAEFHPDGHYLKGEDGQYPTPDHALAASYGLPARPRTEVQPAPEAVPPFVPTPGGTGKPWGVVTEFANGSDLLAAAKKVVAVGYTHVDAWTPFYVHGMKEAIGRTRSRLPLFTLAGALTGLTAAATMQFYFMAYYYPTIVGGKEYRSWEGFVPIFFEMTVLFAGFFTLFALVGLCGLPKFFHPIDSHPTFNRSTQGGFFLSIEATDPSFHPDTTRAYLESLGGKHAAVVEA
ncbi:Molybdopterin oxidoreductase [Frigoriglobus tundricola]|uniref:Molybdopterin oxidoreductase n=1 Tax=Frigoriglobus tundricola TaxID=2774151 RepID=A0A6M5YMG1_9BACT|nr:quinol:electron acceptor oxidoreductase subunit ActD [Frigoriglobus tundricola]QJW94530.1 Molybdopterin oxidoreductase [Frigoriglobus tundricola]